MKITRHIPEKVDLYFNDEYVNTLNNEIELFHVQVEIARDSLEGYTIKWKDYTIKISSNGELEMWPSGMYDQPQRLFLELIKIRKSKRDEKK